MAKVAIIGGGIVGVTCAFYLSKANVSVDLYDDPTKAQGTRAAVGIICPWVSQRRNKAWYALACDGADFYQQLLKDVKDTRFYQQNGALVTHDRLLGRLYELALERAKTSPLMGDVSLLEGEALKPFLPEYVSCSQAIYVPGGAQIDGALYLETLLAQAQNIQFIPEHAYYDGCMVNGKVYDDVVVAAGPWVGQAMATQFDVRAQKGQLIVLEGLSHKRGLPVFMPQGEIDFLYNEKGALMIGASHDDQAGFECDRDLAVERRLLDDAAVWGAGLADARITGYRIGTRATRAEGLPVYGRLQDHLYVATGLGSSGLTTGPVIGYRIARAILGDDIDFSACNPERAVI